MARWSSKLRGDIWGGLASGVLTVPLSIGLGLFAFGPLGPGFLSYGIIAGLYSAVIVSFVGLLLGHNSPLVYAPRSMAMFLVGSSIAHLLAAHYIDPAAQTPRAVLTLIFLMGLLAGAFQLVFGLLRLGTLVKYMPHPVIAGFQNGAAILLFVSQVPAMTGIETQSGFEGWLAQLRWSSALTVLVAAVTCTAAFRAPRFTRRIPGVILGLIAGCVFYYLLAGLGLGAHLGPLIGPIPPAFHEAFYAPDFAAVLGAGSGSFLPILVSSALSLAIIASLDSVLCSKIMENVTHIRSQSNLELVHQGAGNIVSALVGGLPSSISLGSSMANYGAGGRTRVSIAVNTALIFLALILLGPVIAYIPRVVVGALLAVTAIRLVDPWTLRALGSVASRQFAEWRSMLVDLLVIVMVAALAVFTNIVLAVATGIAVAIVFFILRMSRSVVRRTYTGDSVHSRRVRSAQDMEKLWNHGHEIKVFELEGPVFFGSAENLAARIDAEVTSASAIVILDLKRVTQIDSTGARILVQIHDNQQREGRQLLLSHVRENAVVATELRDLGVASAVTQSRLFEDIDRAIEYAEDQLLLRYGDGAATIDEFPFHTLEILAGFDAAELAAFKRALAQRSYRKGDWIFRAGDPGEEMFLLAKGRASVKIVIPGGERERRLVTFAPGTVFGEMALLDRESRSASLRADEDLVCYVLPFARFTQLNHEHPGVAIKLLTNLGRELSYRLRRANRTIYQLEI
jgi:SulP family sulfate permease